jgi:tRNA threonylcarbamoyladenosine biosynthesis protein TsaB
VKILALDTATEACSVALGLDAGPGGRVFERYLELERGHAEQLLPMVDSVLEEAGCALGSLDAIAFGRGPGGFTGVRLAASVAQGLAFGAGLGVLPVSDLAAVALRAAGLHPGAARVLVVNDARMREVYWAQYSGEGKPAGEERVGSAATVELPDATSATPWIAAGRGLAAWPELAERCRQEGAAAVYPDLLPRATEVLALARRDAAAGGLLRPEAALPVYVRDKVADVSPS